jgi:hypothetical protein
MKVDIGKIKQNKMYADASFCLSYFFRRFLCIFRIPSFQCTEVVMNFRETSWDFLKKQTERNFRQRWQTRHLWHLNTGEKEKKIEEKFPPRESQILI